MQIALCCKDLDRSGKDLDRSDNTYRHSIELLSLYWDEQHAHGSREVLKALEALLFVDAGLPFPWSPCYAAEHVFLPPMP